MRKERNCGMPYPVYQNGMMPIMPINMAPGMNQMNPNMQYTNNNFLEQQLNSIQDQINSLDNRVSKLEMGSKNNQTTYNNKYNDSNYYML